MKSRTTSPKLGFASAVITAAILAGCGGGAGSHDSAPSIGKQPADVSVPTGATATFAVAASGGRLAYQWYRNGVEIPGADQSIYSEAAVVADDHAQFTVLVSNSAGTVMSQPATITLTLAAVQQDYENIALNGGGEVAPLWNLPATGSAGTGDSFGGILSVLAKSPLGTPPELIEESTVGTVQTLTTDRVIINDAIYTMTHPGTSYASYVAGNNIQIDHSAYNVVGTVINVAVGTSEIRSNISYNTLSGSVSQAPDPFKNFFNVIYSNPNNLGGGSWNTVNGQTPGYLQFTATQNGDTYYVTDCFGSSVTTTETPNPCIAATTATLSEVMTSGVYDPVLNVTHVLNDGSIVTAQGTSIWVSATPLPSSVFGPTLRYLTYALFPVPAGSPLSGDELVQGYLVKDGTTLYQNQYSTMANTPTTSTQITLNVAAYDDLLATVQQ